MHCQIHHNYSSHVNCFQRCKDELYCVIDEYLMISTAIFYQMNEALKKVKSGNQLIVGIDFQVDDGGWSRTEPSFLCLSQR